MSILIVDDDPTQLEVLSLILENRGHATKTAKSSQEADAMIAEQDFDLVITDLNMAGGSGIVVLETAKAKNNRLPVIICTANHLFITDGKWRHLGFDAAVSKPEEASMLYAKINLLLSGYPRILIVEPHDGIRDFLAQTLMGWGFAVGSVDCPQKAMAQIMMIDFQLITMANGLGDQTGKDLAKRIRCTGVKTPMAMISNDVSSPIFASGEDDFLARLPKPFKMEWLRQLVQMI